METAHQTCRQQCCGTRIIMRNNLIFMSLLTCAALLYRIAPSMLHGTESDSIASQTIDALPEANGGRASSDSICF